MNEFEKQREREKVIMPLWQVLAIRRGLIRTCINCDHWVPNQPGIVKDTTEECSLARGQRPPAIVIALGCDSWQEEIPF